jgi:hypothetical protein
MSTKVLEIVRREAIGAGGSCILKLFSVGCTGKIRGFLEWWFRPLPKVLYLFLYSACIQFEFGEPASAS